MTVMTTPAMMSGYSHYPSKRVCVWLVPIVQYYSLKFNVCCALSIAFAIYGGIPDTAHNSIYSTGGNVLDCLNPIFKITAVVNDCMSGGSSNLLWCKILMNGV